MKPIMLAIGYLILALTTIAAGPGDQPETAGQDVDPEVMAGGSENTGQPEDAGQPEAVNTAVETQQQNQGEATQIQNQVMEQVRTGTLTTPNGKQVQVAEQANNRVQISSGNMAAETGLKLMHQDGQELKAQLSNGRNAEIKVMPDTASEKAMERLQLNVCSAENGCSIELKEVGSGEQTRAAYEVQAQKQAKFLGMFKVQMQVQAQVDAENGEVIQSKKPWWAFMASE